MEESLRLPDPPPPFDPAHRPLLLRHVGAWLGSVEGTHDDPVPDDLRIDLHFFGPGPEHPFRTVVTSGMSTFSMVPPLGVAGECFAELVFLLPPWWPVSGGSFQAASARWPVQLLRRLARLPRDSGSWLGVGHAVAEEGDPPPRFAPGVPFKAVLLLPPSSLPAAFGTMPLRGGRKLRFLAVHPLHWDEFCWVQREGVEPLLRAFAAHGVGDVLDPARRSVVPRRRKGWRAFSL